MPLSGSVIFRSMGQNRIRTHSLTFFRELFRAKLKMLEEMETSLPFQTFRKEFDQIRQSGLTGWIWIERFVPTVFALFFLCLVIARIIQLMPAANL